MKYSLIPYMALGLFAMISSCQKNDSSKEGQLPGKITVGFEHFLDGQLLAFDEMRYTNTAGNQYEISEIQWFISDLTLHKSDESKLELGGEKFAHYVDTNIPETLNWNLSDNIPVGEYQSISMTFGIKGEKNKPYMFTDPPESDMIWPINLGGEQGGYHYMKMNGFWLNPENQRTPFNFHLGVGQQRDATNNIIGFVQNWFEVELPSSSFSIDAGEHKNIMIRMSVEKWWDTPNSYNHDELGGKIMQNQEAMRMGVENGRNVFTISEIRTVEESL